jgi:hypothetical protein
MTKITVQNYRLAEIELEARRMRAEMLANGVRRAVAWFRKPRTHSAPTVGRTV